MFNFKSLSLVSSVNFSRTFLRAAGLLALFIVGASAIWLAKANAQNASAGQAQTTQEVPTLEVGKPIERELAGGQSHTYQLSIPADKYIKLTVKQQGVDLKLRFSTPSNKLLIDWDRQPADKGTEELGWVVDAAGNYRLEVASVVNVAKAGSYEINWAELRQADEKERSLTGAYRLWQEAANLYDDRKYDHAFPKVHASVQLMKSVLGAKHTEMVIAVSLLARVYHAKGYYLPAESYYKQAIAIREKALGAEHPDVAILLNDLANMYADKSDYAAAESYYKRALAIREKALGAVHPDVAILPNGLSSPYLTKEDYATAKPLHNSALAIREKAMGAESLDETLVFNAIAHLSLAKGDYTEAESFYKRALAIRERVLGAEHPDVARSLNHLANLYFVKGDLPLVESLYQRALAINEKVLGAEHPFVVDSLYSLAHLYRAKGDYAAAESFYERALASREKVLGTEHPDVALSLNNFASLYKDKGDAAQAVPLLNRMLAIHESNLRRNLVGSERQQQDYLTTFSESVNVTLALHLQSAPENPQALQLALTAMLHFKGRSLDESTDTLNRLRSRADKNTQFLLDQLFSVRSQYATLVLRGPDERTLKTYRSRLEQLGQEIETLEADLSRRSLEFRTTTLPITLEAVTAAIPANAALVEFVQYRPVEAKTDKRLAPRYVAYLLTAQNEPRWVDLGDVAAIDVAVEQLRQALRDSKRLDYRRLSRLVDKQVMEPVRKLIGGKTQLLLSPDGMLNLLPFAVLVDDDGKFLLERYKLTYLSSGRDLLRLQIKQNTGMEVFVMAAPDFEQSAAGSAVLAANTTDVKRDIVKSYGSSGNKLSESVSMEKVYFRPLPWTAIEAASLKTIMPDAKVMTDGAATEIALKQLRRPRLLHVATHGYFLKDLVMTEATKSERPATELPQKTVEGEKIENPLLRSGLALAGANKRKSGDDDGILTALEAAGLDLWGTKLVVLSACDTGVGEVKNGDGVYGLRRAFVLAGSETQVMSLWSVSDQGTKELMVEYYKRLLRGEGRGEALRQVQLRMLKNPKRSHPFYWASFIQSGEWANLDGKR